MWAIYRGPTLLAVCRGQALAQAIYSAEVQLAGTDVGLSVREY